MNKPRLACGHRAKNPYLFDKMMVKIYSPEELCYCIMLDAYLLDESFVSNELADWIGNECGLEDLSSELKSDIRKKCGVDEFVRRILCYIGFYENDFIEETCQVIRDNSSLSLYEKNQARADYYLMSGRVRMALSAYNELLETIPEKEKTVRAAIWHNCGYAYVRMFKYNEAAKAFFFSYKTLPNDETLRQFLTALRLHKNDEEYLEFITAHPEFYEMSQKVERNLKQAETQFEATEEHIMLSSLKMLREEGAAYNEQRTPYYERLDEIVGELKNSYREMVMM